MSEDIAGAKPATKTSVVLVDDHAIWRDGVKSMLHDTEFDVVGEASSGREGLEVARQLKPDLILLDIRMAGGDGLDALQALKAEHPLTAVVMLTTYDNPTYMARAVAGGAAGYLLKGVDSDELLAALRSVADGQMLLTKQDLVRSLRGVSQSAGGAEDLIQPLTEREQEVLRLLSTGINNRELGGILFIGEATVKTHVEHIIGKLGVSDRVQAAVWAARHGLAPDPEPISYDDN
jgi:DNA-binding NarL/FixJ family response regulator